MLGPTPLDSVNDYYLNEDILSCKRGFYKCKSIVSSKWIQISQISQNVKSTHGAIKNSFYSHRNYNAVKKVSMNFNPILKELAVFEKFIASSILGRLNFTPKFLWFGYLNISRYFWPALLCICPALYQMKQNSVLSYFTITSLSVYPFDIRNSVIGNFYLNFEGFFQFGKLIIQEIKQYKLFIYKAMQKLVVWMSASFFTFLRYVEATPLLHFFFKFPSIRYKEYDRI